MTLAAALARPPGPKNASLLLGVLPSFRKDPPGFLLSVAREYGDLAYMRLGAQNAYLVSHPDWIRDILVTDQAKFTKSRMLERAKVLLGEGLLTSEGEFHTRQRRMVQPAFHRDRLVRYASDMVACASRAADQWQSGATLDVSREMLRLTLAIVGRTLFSADVSSDADEIGAAMTQIFGLFDTLLLPFSDWIQKLPLPPVRRFHRARARLDQIVYRLIAERRASGKDAGDLLSMLLLAHDEDGEARMTDRQARDEALTLLIAGHETTANALTWTWYLLSQNSHAEARMHEELARVLGGRPPEFDDLPRLPYTTGVFAEALRLYSPAWAVGRRAKQDYPIGNYVIPAKSILLMSPWVVHRDPRWWSDQGTIDPEKFDPDRWGAEQIEKRPRFAYFPFGGGTRVCIGERFAWAEGVLVLATIAQRWRFRLVPGHPVATHAVITLRTRYGMKMKIESVIF
jgi:cytochrome P450